MLAKFHVFQTVFIAHSQAEDEVIFPALRRRDREGARGSRGRGGGRRRERDGGRRRAGRRARGGDVAAAAKKSANVAKECSSEHVDEEALLDEARAALHQPASRARARRAAPRRLKQRIKTKTHALKEKEERQCRRSSRARRSASWALRAAQEYSSSRATSSSPSPARSWATARARIVQEYMRLKARHLEPAQAKHALSTMCQAAGNTVLLALAGGPARQPARARQLGVVAAAAPCSGDAAGGAAPRKANDDASAGAPPRPSAGAPARPAAGGDASRPVAGESAARAGRPNLDARLRRARRRRARGCRRLPAHTSSACEIRAPCCGKFFAVPAVPRRRAGALPAARAPPAPSSGEAAARRCAAGVRGRQDGRTRTGTPRARDALPRVRLSSSRQVQGASCVKCGGSSPSAPWRVLVLLRASATSSTRRRAGRSTTARTATSAASAGPRPGLPPLHALNSFVSLSQAVTHACVPRVHGAAVPALQGRPVFLAQPAHSLTCGHGMRLRA